MKVAAFYYTQSSQALNVTKSICKGIAETENSESNIIIKQIVPCQHYPFPWSKDEFFNAFPESRLSMPPSGIEPIDFTDIMDADVVIIVGQSWFLSPSLPIQSFFMDNDVKAYLRNRNVIFVNACRNMWLMTARKIKAFLKEAGAHLVGHIVLQDEAPNLVSVITIIRWLMYGKKEATTLLPAAGIDEKDITEARRFGRVIAETWREGAVKELQQRLLDNGAIKYKPGILFMETVGHRMFGLWAKFIIRKGSFGDKRRRFRQNMFYIYLLTVLFVVSPFGLLFFYLTYPLRGIKELRIKDCSTD